MLIEPDPTLAAEMAQREALRGRVLDEFRSNRQYLAIDVPTATQLRQQVDRLTRQNMALMRFAVDEFNEPD